MQVQLIRRASGGAKVPFSVTASMTTANRMGESRDTDEMLIDTDYGVLGYDIVGNFSNIDCQIGIEFALPVNQGATITSAKLKVWQGADYGGNAVPVHIQVYDVDNAEVFSDAHTHTISNHQSLYAPSASTSAWSTTYETSSVDMTTQVQYVVNRGGWANGNYIGFVLTQTTSNQDYFRQIWDDTSNPGTYAHRFPSLEVNGEH